MYVLSLLKASGTQLKGSYYLAQESERRIIMFIAGMILLSMIPFAYAKWRRNREFKTIRNEIMSMTDGKDLGFTRKRYSKNRQFIVYVLPVLFILINAFSYLPFTKNTEDWNPYFVSVMGFYMLIVFVKDCLASNKEAVIYLEDILNEEELLKYSNDNLNYTLYFVGRNEKSYPIKKDKIKTFIKEDNLKKIEVLPLPILDLQDLVKNSIDEEVKKEAEEALHIANELFDKSKERKDAFKKDFARMNQKSLIRTALEEMRKY